MPRELISPVKLKFDPSLVEDEDTKAVFQDQTARVLWLAISPFFLRNQYFARECLLASRLIQEQELIGDSPIQSAEKIKYVLLRCFGHPLGQDVTKDEFFNLLLPALFGERELQFEIVR